LSRPALSFRACCCQEGSNKHSWQQHARKLNAGRLNVSANDAVLIFITRIFSYDLSPGVTYGRNRFTLCVGEGNRESTYAGWPIRAAATTPWAVFPVSV